MATRQLTRPIIKDDDRKDQLEYLSVDAIKLWDGNTKKHTQKSVKRLASGIEKYGQQTPVVVWRKDKQIRKGNGTYIAITEILGGKHIWVKWADFSCKAEADLYGTFDNKSNEFSEVDDDMLREIFTRDDVIGLTGQSRKRLEEFSGFTEEDLSKIFLDRDERKISDKQGPSTVKIECMPDERDELIAALSQWAPESGFTDLIVY